MTSIYQRVLGEDFFRLHPKIQERFGFESRDNIAAVGTGTMDRVWHGRLFTLPFLMVGTWRAIMFPESGVDVPFTIQNYAYIDRFGRETVTWIRTFRTRKTRRFDATMIYSAERGRVVDYLGTHQHLAVDIDATVDEATGGLRLRSGEQRFYEGPIAFRFPMALSGVADVCEWFDDSTKKYRISVKVTNARFGPLFGYEGSFDVEWTPVGRDAIPADVKPVREERRE
ncbi:MAG: DUF4166 domain-containing protein [Armatimonadota bacterium]